MMHNRLAYEYGLADRNGKNWRAWKRGMRKIGMWDPVQEAYYTGQYEGHYGKKQTRHYPPGKRADAYRIGYKQETRS